MSMNLTRYLTCTFHQIFGLLGPVDLLHLSRTTKAFRKVLLSNNAVSVWKAARVNRGGVPNCMPGMSEVEWANLLFGGSQCYVCILSVLTFCTFMTTTLGVWHQGNYEGRLRYQTQSMYLVPQEKVSITLWLCPHVPNDSSSLVYKPNFSSTFPSLDPIIMDLTPFTNSEYTPTMTC